MRVHRHTFVTLNSPYSPWQNCNAIFQWTRLDLAPFPCASLGSFCPVCDKAFAHSSKLAREAKSDPLNVATLGLLTTYLLR